MIIENLPQKYSPRAHNPPNPKHPVSHRFQKTLQTPCVSLSLHTESTPEHCSYTLQADLANKSYKSCLEIMKDEQKWNPLLVRSQIDVYSHTRKDVVKLPGKLEKIFRFREREEISMVLEADGQGEGHG